MHNSNLHKTSILIIGDKPKWHTIEGYVKDIYERGGNHKIQRIIWLHYQTLVSTFWGDYTIQLVRRWRSNLVGLRGRIFCCWLCLWQINWRFMILVRSKYLNVHEKTSLTFLPHTHSSTQIQPLRMLIQYHDLVTMYN